MHVQKLPDFDGRINARSCELLLQYLTAPYLRIPLVLRFFAAPERTISLANEQLQDMLDAVLFEPGVWRSSNDIKCPEQVPSINRKHLSTPLGLLFNELQKSPDGILVAVNKLLQNVLELDAGRYDASSTPAILYVVRLIVRIQSFVHTLLRHAIFTGDANEQEVNEAMGGKRNTTSSTTSSTTSTTTENDTEENKENKEDAENEQNGTNEQNDTNDINDTNETENGNHTTGVNGATYIRGFNCSKVLANKLLIYCKRWRYDMLHRIFPMLLTWARRAVAKGAVSALCVIRAHLAYLFRNASINIITQFEEELEKKNLKLEYAEETKKEKGTITEQLTVRTLLCSQIYLTASYRFDVEPLSTEVMKRFGRSDVSAKKKKAAAKAKAAAKKKKNKKSKKNSKKLSKKKDAKLFNNEYATGDDDDNDNDTEMLVNASLGIPQMELFSLFQLKRGHVLKWLEMNPKAANTIMEECVHVVTNKLTNPKKKENQQDDGISSLSFGTSANHGTVAASMKLEARSWKPLITKMCSGRFVPDTEAETRHRQLLNIDHESKDIRYEEWLRQTTTLGVDTEVNVQLGEFTLKKHRVEPVDPRMTQFTDFKAVFGTGSGVGTTGFQCAEVKNTTCRLWVRMVGRRHDLKLWSSPRDRTPENGCWPSKGPYTRLFPSQIRGSTETWILDTLRPYIASIPSDRRQFIIIHLHKNVHSR